MTSEPPISESKDAKLDQIMNELDNPNLNELPASAIEAAREHREQIIMAQLLFLANGQLNSWREQKILSIINAK